MVRYVLNRLVSGVVTLFLFVTLLFFVANAVIPGDYVSSLGPMTADQATQIRADLGLDQPLYVQYMNWLGSLVTLDLGESFSRGPVWEAVRMAMAPTMVVLAIGLSVAFVLGGWMGRTAGYRRRSLFAGSATLIAIACLTVFPPALGVALEQGVNSWVGWAGLGEVGTLSGSWLASEITVSGALWRVFFVFAGTAVVLWAIEALVWRLGRRRLPRWVFLIAMVAVPWLVWGQMGLTESVLDLAGAMSLLIVAVVLLTFGEVFLVTKASMDDVMLEDYVMVARAKGLPERQVRDRHAARAALLPVLSRFTVAIPYFLTGLVILEVVFAGSQQSAGLQITGTLMRFAAPAGLGTLLFGALSAQDTVLLIGALVVVGVVTLVLRIVLDVVHAALDPRIRFAVGDDAA